MKNSHLNDAFFYALNSIILESSRGQEKRGGNTNPFDEDLLNMTRESFRQKEYEERFGGASPDFYQFDETSNLVRGRSASEVALSFAEEVSFEEV